MINSRFQLEEVNPLTSLTESVLIARLLDLQAGRTTDAQWLFFWVEKTCAPARAAKHKLINSLKGMDWEIKIRSDVPEEQQAAADAQQKTLRDAYESIGNLEDAMIHLALAELRGYAHCEIIRAGQLLPADPRFIQGSWAVVELRIVDQWFITRDGFYGQWRYNPEARAGYQNQGIPLKEGNWIIRRVHDPIDEIFARAHLDIELAKDDWEQCNDTFAVPPIFIEGPPNASPDQEAEFQEIAEAIVSDGRGYIPNGAKVHTITLPTGASDGFEKRLEWAEAEIVLAATNSTLTMLAKSGTGTLGGNAHSDTFDEVAEALAMDVSKVMQRQFDSFILREAHPNERPLVYFEYCKATEEDVEAHLLNAKTANEAGVKISTEQLSEKTGYELSDAPLPAAPGAELSPTTATAAESPTTVKSPSDSASVVSAENPLPQTTPASPAPGALAAPAPGAAEKVAPTTVETPIPYPSRAGEAEPGIVAAAMANSVGIEEKWLAPIARIFAELEATILDPARTDEEITALLQQAHDGLPSLLPEMDIAALADALEEAGTPGAIQGLRDALDAKTGRKK